MTARNLARLCGEWRHRLGLPDAWVVSNRVADLPRSMTHARARGSNDLIGRDVVQTMAFMSPAEYERVQAINAWAGRSDGIENGCHWTLDMTFREDESRIRDRQVRENFAWLNRFTLSLLKHHPSKDSVAMKRRACGWSDEFLQQVLAGTVP